jgi:hypothetical protein
MRRFACEVGELTAIEKRIAEGEDAEALAPELVAAANAVLAFAPTWEEATAALAEVGRQPLSGGPEVLEAYLGAVLKIAYLVPLPEDQVQ